MGIGTARERGPDSRLWGSRARAERTWNMPPMSVTLDVSKLSGWSNADALRNISYMFVMPEVSKLSGWLNTDAP